MGQSDPKFNLSDLGDNARIAALRADEQRIRAEHRQQLEAEGIDPDSVIPMNDVPKREARQRIDAESFEKMQQLNDDHYKNTGSVPVPLGWKGDAPSYDVNNVDGLLSHVTDCLVMLPTLLQLDEPYYSGVPEKYRILVCDAYCAALALGVVDAIPSADQMITARDIEYRLLELQQMLAVTAHKSKAQHQIATASGEHSAQDGPCDPYSWRRNGELIQEELQRATWNLVNYLWQQRNKTAYFNDLAKPVFGDSALKPDAHQVGRQRTLANDFFKKHAVPWIVATSPKDRRVWLRSRPA